ncbi:BspA family leucine-rich repeat surface protein [Shigella sonnei]|nr:BspA family leucine-rich repeat surface protein [Shigella sonnei]
MKIKQSWKDELLALVNSKNSLQLTLDDVKFELTAPVSKVPGAVTVTIKPADNSRYFNEQSLTYIRRDIAKNFTGIPLRVIVNNDTTVRDAISTIASRYGLIFDTTVDFLESELNKQITFTDTGIKDVTVPVADTSYVWAGNLQFNIANDKLSLITIIKKTDLTNLVYLDGVEANTTGSLLLATAALIDNNNNPELPEGMADAGHFQNVLKMMVRYGDITQEHMQQAMETINQTEDVREVERVSYGDAELVVTTKKDWAIGNLKGAFVLARFEKEKPFQYVLKTNGGSVTLALNGWTNITIDWGDGNKSTLPGGQTRGFHEYSDSTERTITATGVLSNPEAPTQTQTISGDNITEIVDWNNGLPQAVQLIGLTSLIKVPDYIPSYWTTLESLFESCSVFNDADIAKWNTGAVTSMKSLFFGCSAFNQLIVAWDVTHVTNIDNMFASCQAFNQDLRMWSFTASTSHNNYDSGATAWRSDYRPSFDL